MQIVQATFGVFHQFELAHQLHKRRHLRKIYTTWPWARVKREGLPHSVVGTFPPVHTTDHLLGRTRFYPRPLGQFLKKYTAITFDEWTLRVMPECDALIAMAGAALKTGALVKRRGGRLICDRGSTHHRFQEEVVAGEHDRWKIPRHQEADGVIERDEAIYAQADVIVVPSQVAGRSYVAMGVPAEKIQVIPYGVRLGKFNKTSDPPTDSFQVIFAGQVGLRKGIPYLLEAFARLRHPKKHLTVAGAIQDHIRPLLAELPTGNVTFLGAIPQAELVDRLSRSHVLVLPSIEEGLALVQAQSMACECPVIATRATGAEDLFTDGVEGFIVEDRDVLALADRMQQIADDPALRARMSAAARLRVKQVGGWDDYGRQWDDLLHRLTGQPRTIDELAL